MIHYLLLTSRDPLIARDGRPFGADSGRRMRCLDWLPPSLVAGSLRTAIGKRHGQGFVSAVVKELKELRFAGAFPYADCLFFPAPNDCVIRSTDQNCLALRPEPVAATEGEGTDLPHQHLQPVVLPVSDVTSFKYGDVPPWWSAPTCVDWLTRPGAPPADFIRPGPEFLTAPARVERWHVEIDPSRLAAVDERLFATSGLEAATMRDTANKLHSVGWAVRAEGQGPIANHLATIHGLHPMGGERRLVHGQTLSGDSGRRIEKAWACPPAIATALATTDRVRMVLATPAAFAGGWRPGWLTETSEGWEGHPPGQPNVTLRLVGACNQRWRAVSGYSLEQGRVGPKPIRRVLPAGAVFFFRVVGGAAADLANLWLRSVNDETAAPSSACDDAADGFGLALWGIW